MIRKVGEPGVSVVVLRMMELTPWWYVAQVNVLRSISDSDLKRNPIWNYCNWIERLYNETWTKEYEINRILTEDLLSG